jgi:hypothetical protein
MVSPQYGDAATVRERVTRPSVRLVVDGEGAESGAFSSTRSTCRGRWIADLRVLGHDTEVSERRELRAAGEAVALDLRDDRPGELLQDPASEEHVPRPVVMRRVGGVNVGQAQEGKHEGDAAAASRAGDRS